MKYGKLGEAIEQLLHAIGVGELPETFLGRGIPPHLQKAFSTGGIEIDLKFRRSGSRLSVILTMARRTTPATADAWQLVAESGQSVLFAFHAPRSHGPSGKKENTAGDRVVETTIGYRNKLANSSSGCIVTSPVSLRSAKHTGHFKTDPLRVYGPTALQDFLKPPQLAAQASLALAHSIYYLLRIHPSGRLAQFWTNVIEVLNAREGR